MGPIAAITTCLRKYADFSGRAARPEFWWFFAAMLLGYIALSITDALIFPRIMIGNYPFQPLSEGFGLATLIPFLAVSTRRLHDTGSRATSFIVIMGATTLLAYLFLIIEALTSRSVTEGPVFMVIAFVSLAALIAILISAIRKSQIGENSWGPAPQGSAS